MDQKPALPIIDALGKEALLGIGLTERNIDQFRWSGMISAPWFGEIEKLCLEAGIPCPRAAFRFKRPVHAQKRGGANDAIQDREGV